MKRRSFLRGSALLTLSSIVSPGFAGKAGAQSVGFVDAVEATRKTVLGHFSQHSYRVVEATALATGRAQLNGGLRHWPPETLQQPGHMVIQPIAKLDDIGERHRPDVLPVFHVFISYRKSGDTPADAFDHQLAFLLDRMKLDRERVVLISSEFLEPFRPVVERHKINWNRQVFMRKSGEAKAAGDGSGFIRIETPGGPYEAATVGVHYWLGKRPIPRIAAYPPASEWTEVGETILDDKVPNGFVIGIERLLLALTGAYPTWDEYMGQLVKYVETSKDPHALKTLQKYRRP